MADPMLEAAAAVYSRLSGDGPLAALAPGGVWETRAPVDIEQQVYPLVVFATLPLRTDYTFTGPYRHVFDLRVTVLDLAEAVDVAGTVAARVYTLMQDADDTALPMAGFDVLYCRRQTANKMSPVRDGEQYQQLVDQYRLEVRPA